MAAAHLSGPPGALSWRLFGVTFRGGIFPMTDQPVRFFNRELSWLEFNQRVLDEALDESLPLLERLKFLAITSSNLDEFFMVRVGGLQILVEQQIGTPDPSGMTPAQQLAAVGQRAHEMVQQQQACFASLDAKLAEAGVKRVRGNELTDRQMKAVEQVFESEIFSVLTPMAVRPGEEFPLLVNQMLHVCRAARPRQHQRRQAAVRDHSAGPHAAAIFHAGGRPRLCVRPAGGCGLQADRAVLSRRASGR